MAQSKAKKQRNKKEREGFRNPEERRYRNVGLTTRIKKDKTKYTRKGRETTSRIVEERPFLFIYGYFGKVTLYVSANWRSF